MTEKPLKALSELTVNDLALHQIINFFYFDPNLIYKRIEENLIQFNEDEKFNEIIENMQSFLDEDKVIINSKEIFLNITDAYISFNKDETFEFPQIIFEVHSTKLSLIQGVNTIELLGDKQKVTYPISIQWNLPGSVLSVQSNTDHKLAGSHIYFFIETGQMIGGYEKITFFY